MSRSSRAKGRPILSGTVVPDDLDIGWFKIDGEVFAVLSHSVQRGATLETLTRAERDIVALLASGCSNAEIASRRGTSRHTVAHQMAAIFRKLGVGSRRELLAHIASGPNEGLE